MSLAPPRHHSSSFSRYAYTVAPRVCRRRRMGSPFVLLPSLHAPDRAPQITRDLFPAIQSLTHPWREALPAVSFHCRSHLSMLNLRGIHCSSSCRCLSSNSASFAFTYGVSMLFSLIFAFSQLALRNAIWIESCLISTRAIV